MKFVKISEHAQKPKVFDKLILLLLIFLVIPISYAAEEEEEEKCGITNLASCIPKKIYEYTLSIINMPLQTFYSCNSQESCLILCV